MIDRLFFLMALTFAVSSFSQSKISDGPYFFKEENAWVSYSIVNGKLKKKLIGKNDGTVNFDVESEEKSNSFEVRLKPGLSYEQSEFEIPEEIVAISDIEGNFDVFRKLLQQTGVVNQDLNWSFGDGHLVLVGDFFDRGDRVTEVLWLIYKLEWEAMEAGGRVHFILGNHETMNLYGDLRYAHPKYKKSAELMGKQLEDLYSDNTELGQWLRTKNVIEKIGNLLFVHAGVSQKINDLGLSIESINSNVKPFLDNNPSSLENHSALLIGTNGLNWFRGYYQSNIPNVVDNTLDVFNVEHIVTGHTVVADTISIHYDGKVINIDTPHKTGKSEALLIEDGSFYRVNLKGDRFPLFPKKSDP